MSRGSIYEVVSAKLTAWQREELLAVVRADPTGPDKLIAAIADEQERAIKAAAEQVRIAEVRRAERHAKEAAEKAKEQTFGYPHGL